MKKTFLVLMFSLGLSLSIYGQTIVGNWTLTSLIIESDMAYGISEPVTLTLDENGKFSGNGGCNDFVGLYSFKTLKKSSKKPQKIEFSDVIFCSTKKDCQMSLNTENAFFRSLKESATVVIENNELVIKSKATVIGKMFIQNTMTFARVAKGEERKAIGRRASLFLEYPLVGVINHFH